MQTQTQEQQQTQVCMEKIDDSFREQLKSPKWNKKSIFLINTFLSLNLTE